MFRLNGQSRVSSGVLFFAAGMLGIIAGLTNIRGHAEVKTTQWIANFHPESTPENLKVGKFLIEGFGNAGIRGFYWGSVTGILFFAAWSFLSDQSPVTTEEKKCLIKKLQEEVDHEEVFAQTYAALKEVQTHDDT